MNDLQKVLFKLFKTHRRTVKYELKKIGLSEGQPKVLNFLVKNNGCIQREIVEDCKINPATVTSILSTMEKENLIYRSQNSENRRILNVFITDSGIVAQKKLGKIFNYLDELCFHNFSEEEKIAAIKLLNKIQNNLEGQEKDSD
jgi:MarR family transcriptional regulator, organic hydroperoxide resistance regulator